MLEKYLAQFEKLTNFIEIHYGKDEKITYDTVIDQAMRIIRKLRKERQEFKYNLFVCENELELLKRPTVSHFTPFCEIDTSAGHSFVTRCVYCGILDER